MPAKETGMVTIVQADANHAVQTPLADAPGGAAHDALAAWSARLGATIESEILPRLLSAHRGESGLVPARDINPDDVAAFVGLIISDDLEQAQAVADRVIVHYGGRQALLTNLLTPASRLLGEMWEQDLCDFVEVSLGIGRLQTLLGEMSQAEAPVADLRRRALLISTQKDQHVFGLDIVASFLRSSGWDTIIEKGMGQDHNAETAATHWLAVAGVTMSREANFDSVARVIVAVRRASMNPSISVMVGGVAFIGRPDLVLRVGADAAANDGPGAALLAQRLYLRQSVAPPIRTKRHSSGQRSAAPTQSRIQASNDSNASKAAASASAEATGSSASVSSRDRKSRHITDRRSP